MDAHCCSIHRRNGSRKVGKYRPIRARVSLTSSLVPAMRDASSVNG